MWTGEFFISSWTQVAGFYPSFFTTVPYRAGVVAAGVAALLIYKISYMCDNFKTHYEKNLLKFSHLLLDLCFKKS